jgi:hypothetical protein
LLTFVALHLKKEIAGKFTSLSVEVIQFIPIDWLVQIQPCHGEVQRENKRKTRGRR